MIVACCAGERVAALGMSAVLQLSDEGQSRTRGWRRVVLIVAMLPSCVSTPVIASHDVSIVKATCSSSDDA